MRHPLEPTRPVSSAACDAHTAQMSSPQSHIHPRKSHGSSPQPRRARARCFTPPTSPRSWIGLHACHCQHETAAATSHRDPRPRASLTTDPTPTWFHALLTYINTRTRRSAAKGSPTFQCRASTKVDASVRLELDENPEAIISGEWPENPFLLSYDDLRAYLESQEAVQEGDQRVALLSETMSTPVLVATAEQTLEEVECHFEAVSGLPVVDSSLRCVGVVVKNDRAKASHGPQTKIEEVMTSSAITLASDKTVMDAAVLMLKKKIHRVPIVNQDEQVIGIITRADVLRELEGLLKI
uniref:CBS domain-containing protein n=1 Tax=Setaria italica TaxID=4555 RepID=K3YUJ6_SETIT